HGEQERAHRIAACCRRPKPTRRPSPHWHYVCSTGGGLLLPVYRFTREILSNAQRTRDAWNGERGAPMNVAMGRNSWILGFRGGVAILFGLYALLVPGRALATLILVFGVCVILEGVLSIVAAVRVHRHQERSFPIALEGIVCVIVGLIALLFPGAAALTWL